GDVPHRRPERRGAGHRAVRLSGDRHLLRRLAHPLRALRRRGDGHLRRPLLLVAEVLRTAVERAAGADSLLDLAHRPESRVLPDAHPRPDGHATPAVHLRARPRLGRPEPDLDDWRLPDRPGNAGLHLERHRDLPPAGDKPRRPMGWLYARMGDDLA